MIEVSRKKEQEEAVEEEQVGVGQGAAGGRCEGSQIRRREETERRVSPEGPVL